MTTIDWGKLSAHSYLTLKRPETGLRKGERAVAKFYVMVLLLAPPTIALAQNGTTDNVVTFDIPPQRADLALTEFAKQADLTLVFRFDEVRNKQANALDGGFSLEEGIQRLLDGTGLTATFSSELILKVANSVPPPEPEGESMRPETKKGLIAGIAAFFVGSGTNAQDSNVEPSSPNSTLEEIVVTARKREESLMETPISITAFSGDQLEALNMSSVHQIAEQTPGLVFDSTSNISGSSNSSSIFIRGIGQRDYTLAIEPGVGLYVDDVYLAHSIGNVIDIVDVERIEVLRGPQGTLFGRNTVGGAVRIITKKPTSEYEGDVELTMGKFDRLDLKAHLNIPFSDNFYGRFSALTQNRDGFVDTVFLEGESGDKDSTSAIAQFRWVPSDRVTTDLMFTYSTDRSNGAPNILLTATTGVAGSGPEVFRTVVAPALNPEINNFLFGPQFVGWNGSECPCVDYSDNQIAQDLDTYSMALTINWDINDMLRLRSITSFRDLESHFGRDGDHVPEVQHVNLEFFTEYDQWSQELQLSGQSFDDRLDWILGGYYYTEDGVSTDDIIFTTLDLISGGGFETDTFAFFGQGTFAVTDRLDLTVGARYTDEEKSAIIDENHQVVTAFLGAGPFKVPNSAQFFVTGGPGTFTDNIEETTTYVNLSYQWNDMAMTYLSYSEGFKGGGVQVRNGPIGFLPRFGPEFAEVIELGAKLSFMGGRFDVTGAAFSTDYTDLQITANVTPPGGVPTSVVTNAGDADITGFEIEFNALPNDNLSLRGGISVLDGEYTAVRDAPGITLDTELPNAPELQYNLSIAYDIHTSSGVFAPRVDFSYTDEQFNDAQNNAILRRDEVNMLNLSIGYTAPSGLWSGALFASNVLDEQVVLAGFDGGFYGDGVISRPFEWGFKIKRSF